MGEKDTRPLTLLRPLGRPKRRARPLCGPKGLSHAGVAPKDDTLRVSVRDVANRFLTSQKRKLDLGEIGQRQFSDYHKSCDFVIDEFGKHRPAEALGPDDFGRLRARISKGRNPTTITNHLVRIRSMFKWAYRAEIIKSLPRYGDEFSKPAPRLMRKARQQREDFFFEAAEIRDLVDLAKNRDPQVAAMILLGINAGLGCTDCAKMTTKNIDLKKRILDYPRPKTSIARRAILWPETVDVIAESQKHKPPAAKPRHSDRLFLTSVGTPSRSKNKK